MQAIELLQAQFGASVKLQERRPNILQVFAPLYHEDGDMMDIYLDMPRDVDLSTMPEVLLFQPFSQVTYAISLLI